MIPVGRVVLKTSGVRCYVDQCRLAIYAEAKGVDMLSHVSSDVLCEKTEHENNRAVPDGPGDRREKEQRREGAPIIELSGRLGVDNDGP